MKKLMMMVLFAFVMTAEEPMTNDDVMKLVNAGLTQDTIETKIFNSATAFRTDTDSIIDLTKQGIPDRIVRAMIARQAEQYYPATAPALPAMSNEPVTASKGTGARYFEVAIHRTASSRCDTGELKVDSAGVHGRGCRPTDFDVYWNEINSVCYTYGSRGVVEFRTAKRKWRVSTDTPAEAKQVLNVVSGFKPKLKTTQGCS